MDSCAYMMWYDYRNFKLIQTNRLTTAIRMNPDERGFFGKMFSKDTFPDYFK